MKCIAVVGPTASGKSERAVELAEFLNWPVVSFDSRQFYREIPIGTAAPGADLRARAPHFFVLDRSLENPLSSGGYAREVEAWSASESPGGAVFVGGSGLYLEALIKGFDLPSATDGALREQLQNELLENGIASICEALEREDPEAYARNDRNNPQRLIRALEIARSRGRASRAGESKQPAFAAEWLVLGLEVEREELNQRILLRSRAMIENGLIEEARSVMNFRQSPVLKTIGYPEAFSLIEGKMSVDTCIETIALRTRQYAKRQRTWFRNRVHGLRWVSSTSTSALREQAEIFLS